MPDAPPLDLAYDSFGRLILSLASGETGRRKTVHISGDPDGLAAKLTAIITRE